MSDTVSGRGRADRREPESPNIRMTEMERRIDKIIQYGTIEETDYDKSLYRVRIGPKKEESSSSSGSSSSGSSNNGDNEDDPNAGYLTDWIGNYVQSADANAVSHNPLARGAQVTVMSPSGDPAAGAYIMPGMYQDKHDNWSKDPNVRGTKNKDGTQSSYNTKTGERINTTAKKSTTQVGKYSQVTEASGKSTLTIGGKAREDGTGDGSLNKDAQGASEDAKKTKVTHHPGGKIDWELGDKTTASWNDGKLNFKIGEKMLAQMVEGNVKFSTGAGAGEVNIAENNVRMKTAGGEVKIRGDEVTMKNNGGGAAKLAKDGTLMLNSGIA